MKQDYKLPEQAYWQIIFRIYAQDAANCTDNSEKVRKWQEVQKLITDKSKEVPYFIMGELCLEA